MVWYCGGTSPRREGKAWIRATFTIDGADFSLWESIPVDEDEDGIADWWEQRKGGDLERSLDSEPGRSGGSMPSPAGDGISAFDEYRGFHVLDQTDLVGVWHERTDPLQKQTVFYWDSNSPQFHNAIQQILAPRTGDFIQFLPVNQQQAHTTSATSLEDDPVGNMASNSADGNSISYALVFADHELGEDELGAALFRRQHPVWISLQNIQDASTDHHFPADVLLAQVVAHESGHKFDLDHPTRIAHHGEHDLFTLPLDMYTRSSFNTRQLYARYSVYLHDAQVEIAEQVKAGTGNLTGLLLEDQAPFPGPTPTPPSTTFVVTMSGALSTTSDSIEILKQEGFLMDWAPRFTLTEYADWDFSAVQYMKLRVKPQ